MSLLVQGSNRPAKARIDLFPYWLSAPTFLTIVSLVGFPFLFAIYISFTDRTIGAPGQWVGLANFAHLSQDPTFWSAVRNTLVIVVVAGFAKFMVGLGLALLVTQNIPMKGLLRSCLMLPWAMPAFVAFLTWRVLYQPVGGGINLILSQTGLYDQTIDWLGQRDTAMLSVLIATIWRGFPFWFISILAALQAVPKELYEAARVDGANAIQSFWSVTWPGIRNVVIVTALLSTIWTANGFEQIWLLTQGGPSDATITFPVLAYFGMQTQRIGEAAAASVYMLPFLFLLLFVVTGIIERGDKK